MVQAGLGSARDHALPSLLALNGLRISEALGADIDHLEYERGHRTLKILRKGGKRAVIPLAPRTSRAVDLYIGERTTGPILNKAAADIRAHIKKHHGVVMAANEADAREERPGAGSGAVGRIPVESIIENGWVFLLSRGLLIEVEIDAQLSSDLSLSMAYSDPDVWSALIRRVRTAPSRSSS